MISITKQPTSVAQFGTFPAVKSRYNGSGEFNMIKRYHIIAEGRVQGVGMRGFCIMNANQLRLTGSVRNMDNGMVEIFAQGEESHLRLFLSTVEEGNRWIRVDSLSVKEVPIVEGEREFSYIW
jgi:acylphosphatase